MNLATLMEGIATPSRDLAIRDIALDSRKVTAGGVFLACRGEKNHGLDFVQQVVERGAGAILWEPDGERTPPHLPSEIAVVEVPQLSARASEIAARFFGRPSEKLAVVGVTGTNGKTTCAWLLAQALGECGCPAAYLGTLGSMFAGSLQAGEHTTPDAVTLQRLLSEYLSQGARCAAIEVSSHALVQSRVAAVRFDAAVFTNLTRDHLDYHGTMHAYGEAKAMLFDMADLRLRVINADDDFGAQLLSRPSDAQTVAYSCREEPRESAGHQYLHARDVQFDARGTSFNLQSSFGSATIRSPMMGAFNVQNVLAVLSVLLGSGITLEQAVPAIARLRAPSGRMERIDAGGGPMVVVDYAHTPDALEKALAVLRQHIAGRLWCVFGCGGDRDRGKRPLMGEVATRLADEVILTDDNPRGESPRTIVRDILAGVGSRTVAVEHDRQAAIRQAILQAAPADAVLVAGKGHEAWQLVGTERLAFSDQRVAASALGQRASA